MAQSGEPAADLNMGLVWAPDGLQRLLDGMDSATSAPFLLLLAEAATPQHLGPAVDYGCTDYGTVPLMVHRVAIPQPDSSGPRISVAQVTDTTSLAVVRTLISSAFGLDAGALTRAFGDGLLARADVAIYLACEAGEPVSSVMVTRCPQGTGIWSMATPPARQRRGFGYALLTEVMARERALGGADFYLFATAAGQALYTRLGYQTVETPRIWARGESAQT